MNPGGSLRPASPPAIKKNTMAHEPVAAVDTADAGHEARAGYGGDTKGRRPATEHGAGEPCLNWLVCRGDS